MKSHFLLLTAALLCPFLMQGADPIQKRIKSFTAESYWTRQPKRPEITRAHLVQALEKSRNYYLNSQREEGNFIYSVDLETGRVSKKDNPVRQAGALWGLACLNRDRFNEPTRQAVTKGIQFFFQNIQTLKSGKRCVVYPGEERISTGMVALYCLALTDFLRGQERYLDDKAKEEYRRILRIHLEYLQSLELPDGSWACIYDVAANIQEPEGSPYYDGEALLAYCKAARYLGHTELIPRINEALPKLIAKYTADIWEDPCRTHDASKGFYQWCCMALNEYVLAGWTPHRELAIDTSLAYSNWLIHHEKVTDRSGNTAYAVEGLLASWNIADITGNRAAQKRIQQTVFDIMGNLMTWQYEGPFMKQNPVLQKLAAGKKPQTAYIGGITASLHDPVVRIDIQQHQTHAMLLMLDYMFSKK